VTVGLFPYPPPESAQRGCGPQTPIVRDHRPLTALLTVEPTVASGGFFKGKVRITNAGAVPYELSTSSSFAVYLFRPGEAIPIGISEGGWMGTGYGKTLAPGESLELPAGGGTASCDLAVGYVVPPGSYQGRALVDYQEPVTFENQPFWSEPAPIQVVAP
jgi:hypothetical protein